MEDFVHWYPDLYDAVNLVKNKVYLDKKDGFIADMVKKASFGIPITRKQSRFIIGLAKARLKELEKEIE